MPTTNQMEQVRTLPAIPKPFDLPFYYSSLFNVGLFYLLPAEKLKKYIRYDQLELATFDGQGCLMFNFQSYTGQFDFGSGITQEIEVQILAYPKAQKDQVPNVSFREYLLGDEQTRLIGNHRIHVPCDAVVAMLAGKLIFDEPKFPATFFTKLPSLNSAVPEAPVNTWEFACYDQSHLKEIAALNSMPDDFKKLREMQYQLHGAEGSESNLIFKCEINLTNMQSVAGNASPITEYGQANGKLTAARWNILQPLPTYFFDTEKDAQRVSVKFGDSTHKMRDDLKNTIDKVVPTAAYTFQSTPDAIQSRPFYV